MEIRGSVMTTLIRGVALAGARIFAFLTGNKIIVLLIEPREAGYSVVSSPDLPGFSMMLEPGETDDIQSLIDALTAPLKAYLEVEGRRLAATKPAPASPVFKSWARSDNKLIATASCL